MGIVATALVLLAYHASLLSGADDRSTAFINYSEKKTPTYVNCEDKHKSCAGWASLGECKKNPGYMVETCPLSCGACVVPELDVAAFRSQGKILVLDTPYGEIRANLLWQVSPQTAALVMELAERSNCSSCNFYRNEAAPTKEEGFGPPYGLLQGNFHDMLKLPVREESIQIKRGHMAFIPGTKDFYISISDHLEWGQAHIVFGEITSWTIIDRIVSQPYTTFKHPSYGTIMRMLVDTVHFTPRAVKPSDT